MTKEEIHDELADALLVEPQLERCLYCNAAVKPAWDASEGWLFECGSCGVSWQS
ncbi:MAG: hypothetical protein WCH05_10025 [Chlorobiaceae bacterium]